MGGLRTEFDFVLPKGYVDSSGQLHRQGTMRLATARDELEPLRDLRVKGPDDPLITIIVLSRVITTLGSMGQVTGNDIQGLFAVDLAYLQDFYGIINFGTDAEIDDMLVAQRAAEQPEDGGDPEDLDAPWGEEPVETGRPAGRRGTVQEVPASER
ncbi:MAG: hypothetical protein JWM47_1402 [Acidimicrobiales bacterium]|nr:hypothetical protein [Acidimicrobiales bacterium]